MVRACAVDDDGRYLVSGGRDTTIRCHNVATGELAWMSDGHADYINKIIVSGSTAYSGDRQGVIRAWDIESGRVQNVFASSDRRREEELMPYLAIIGGLLVIVSDFFQFMAFPFTVDLNWNNNNPSTSAFPPVQFDFDVDIDVGSWFKWLYSFSVAFVLLMAVLFHSAYRFVGEAREPSLKGYIWKLTALIVWTGSTVLLIPVFRTLLSVFKCEDGDSGDRVLTTEPTITCWDRSHIIMCAFVAPTMLVYVFMTM
jgi:hypothetical protein